ncbi:MAG: hypothetical protein N3E45_13320 [Oscillatoriaceae bacterium SKW80]|nr:hypothetical protein [Oscillatoriaceae bacterium SKYG93]MCX8121780.1 hypothetical protein [Oscillatoriaceae bacterium SKW80]MDW8452565.1 hypothetical protein [Oscillatoriaceae cyanobacterium SKYGB_i_bin93]HIK28668.1 hypothetical protein [Oscillatoriaceae cyanobacterium M7585_C2015_266]
MLQESHLAMIATLNDIEALIEEIDNNPHLSIWVVRLILKSIKDNGKRRLQESLMGQGYIENVIDVQVSRS